MSETSLITEKLSSITLMSLALRAKVGGSSD